MHSGLTQATHTVTFYITPKEKQIINGCLNRSLSLESKERINRHLNSMKDSYVRVLDLVLGNEKYAL